MNNDVEGMTDGNNIVNDESGPSESTNETLGPLRRKIDEIDDQLLALLIRRADLATLVGDVKRRARLAILDLRREQAVLDRLLSQSSGQLSDASLSRIFSTIIDECRGIVAGRARLIPEDRQ